METIETIINGYRARMQQADRGIGQPATPHLPHQYAAPLLLFAAGVAGLIVLRSESWTVLAGIALVTFVPFVGLIQYHNRLFARKDYLEKRKGSEQGRRLPPLADYDTSAFDDGPGLCRPGAPVHLRPRRVRPPLVVPVPEPHLHPAGGKTAWPPGWASTWRIRSAIEARQEAVRELATATGFRQRFRILGLLHKGKAADESELRAWGSHAFHLPQPTRC